MTPHLHRSEWLAGVILLAHAALAAAQPAPESAQRPPGAPRADVAAAAGWFGDRREVTRGFGDAWNGRRHLSAVAGVYWSPHLKTEVELARTGLGEQWVTDVVSQPVPIYLSEERRIRSTRVAVGQFWQFGRNAWVHPLIGGGLELDRETVTRDLQPWFGRPGEPSRPGELLPAETALRVKGFVSGGAKFYVAETGFIRTDLRVAAGGGGSRQVLWRVGAGLDF
jgi:hypothetical protein